MEEVKNTKLIGIGNEGIKKLEEVESKIVEKIDTEKIMPWMNIIFIYPFGENKYQ